MAVTVEGTRDILGIWVGDGGEGAKYWLHVFTELKNRGLGDVLMLVCDGLRGLPERSRPSGPARSSRLHPSTLVGGETVSLVTCAVSGTTYANAYLRGPHADLPARGGGGLHIGQRESRLERRDEVPRKPACTGDQAP
jgi:Transposase, Mutator family